MGIASFLICFRKTKSVISEIRRRIGKPLAYFTRAALREAAFTQMPDIRTCMGPIALVRAVGLGARDDLLAHLPAQRQPGIDIKLRVNERVEG